jgi:large subunit ribosomal protein L15
LLRIPKTRGFQSQRPKPACVNIKDLQNNFENGATINARTLLKAGLISDISHGVKILSLGTLSKKLTVEAEFFSASAQDKITKAGGQAVVVGKPAIKKVLKQAKNKQDA